jgi:hypothetical protein
MESLLSLVLYAAVAAGWAAVAWWLGRPLPARFFLVFLLLPVLFLLPAFVTTRTIFPVDHAMSLPPWSALPHRAPANPNLNDNATEIAPWAKAVRLAWKEGAIPWRNRWNACGSPLAANGQSAAFSPLTIHGPAAARRDLQLLGREKRWSSRASQKTAVGPPVTSATRFCPSRARTARSSP